MRKTTILLVRHGQSEGNVLGVFTGHSGYALTDLGHKQAAMTAEYIRNNYKVDAVYSSDLPRAFQTAEHIANAFALPVVTDCRLREIDAGVWENKPFADLPDLFPDAFTLWLKDLIHSRCTGGESVLEVSERAMNTLRDITDINSGKCVAVVAHATSIRTALWKASGATKDAMDALSWGVNCGISEITCIDGNFQIAFADYSEHLAGFESALPTKL